MSKTITTPFFSKLSKISDVILADEINFSDLLTSLTDMKSLFMEVSEIDTESPEFTQDIHLTTGKAIGPYWAGLCVDDLLRTKRFSKGAFQAIEEMKSKKNGEPVTLLYVGPGPFATLILPLLTQFKPEELQLILVEVNPATIAALKNTIKNVGVEEYIKEIIMADASQLQLENASEIDVLLLECLQFALVKEQQVAITYNLVPQLRKDAILVPDEIKLSVGVVDSVKKMAYMTHPDDSIEADFYKDINTVFVLSKEAIWNHISNFKTLDFPEINTTISKEDKKNFTSVVISTDICVHSNQKLLKDECSLTMSYKLSDTNQLENLTTVKTKYEVNEKPGLKIEWI
jgi:predicted RNA methylase